MKNWFVVIVLFLSMGMVAQESNVAEGQQKIDDANVIPWTIKTPGEYENVYRFGYSELESDLVLLFDNDKYYGQIRSGSWKNSGTLWSWKYENLTNIRVEGSKFYSDQTDGEFVIYDNGKEKKKGLKVYKPWNSYPNAGKSDVGFVTNSVDKTKQLLCSGIYKYGTSPQDGRFGILYVYPVSDTTMIIYLELSGGKPSYNSGALYGVIDVNKQGVAYYKDDESYLDCSIKFSFEKDLVDIVTDRNHCNCPFGSRVFADGHYRKVSFEIPKSFVNRHADTIYFKTLKEKYESGESIPCSD